jgi:hypothetical protein
MPKSKETSVRLAYTGIRFYTGMRYIYRYICNLRYKGIIRRIRIPLKTVYLRSGMHRSRKRKGQKSSNASQAQRSASITDVSVMGYQ